jgi:flagellar motility protein MotE (MotC chaperone)
VSKASAAERRRLIVDTYRSMSAEGLAEVVQDLMKEELPQDAASVLGILEERKAAKVLALLSGPEPEFAARLTAQLRDGSVKLQ